MPLLQKLLTKINGLHYPQEYLCIGQESFEQPLHVYLAGTGKVVKDITICHAFVGYHPLILALGAEDAGSDTIDIIFCNKVLQPNEVFSKKDAIATLRLKKIKGQPFKNHVSFYEGIDGKHSFVSSFHQWIIGLNNSLYNKKKGNVFLHDNLYKQVQIAYALPRNISLITVEQNNSFNLFPTDLHGTVDEQHYIISLRFSGKACRQVESTGKIIISQVEKEFYKTVYGLGKNHMQEMKAKENFPFSELVSSHLQLPIPESALFCRELELLDSFNHGIHKLMFFRVLSGRQVQDNPSTLAHIHNAYATWRYNNRLPGNYLLR
jgi:flavin reductase (DIM6/NTAB) family NADH-FMN oxidoreductase RutF